MSPAMEDQGKIPGECNCKPAKKMANTVSKVVANIIATEFEDWSAEADAIAQSEQDSHAGESFLSEKIRNELRKVWNASARACVTVCNRRGNIEPKSMTARNEAQKCAYQIEQELVLEEIAPFEIEDIILRLPDNNDHVFFQYKSWFEAMSKNWDNENQGTFFVALPNLNDEHV